MAKEQRVREVPPGARPPTEPEGELHRVEDIRAELRERVVEEPCRLERLRVGEDLLVARDRVVVRHDRRALRDEVVVVVVILRHLACNYGGILSTRPARKRKGSGDRRTDGGDGDPSQNFRQDRVDVGEVRAVGHRREPLATNRVDLGLSSLLDIPVLSHGEKERECGGFALHRSDQSGRGNQYLRGSEHTASMPPVVSIRVSGITPAPEQDLDSPAFIVTAIIFDCSSPSAATLSVAAPLAK